MYDIIVIDDEELIREGMSTLVDWDKLGFRVVSVFEDGEKAIKWLDNNHADIILTDLFLGGISGIDIAEYVYESQIQSKVVILSGHSDFVAAQKALDFRVSAFLLKPISIKRIREVFANLKEELDTAEKLRSAKDYTEYVPNAEIEFCFVEDLISGVLRNNKRLYTYMEMLNIYGYINNSCCIVTLEIENYDNMVDEFDKDIDSLVYFIWNNMSHDNSLFLSIGKLGQKITGLMLNADCSFMETLKKNVDRINTLVNAGLKIYDTEQYDSINSMINAWPYKWTEQTNEFNLVQLREKQQIIISYILQEDTEQVSSYYNAFLASFKSDIEETKNITIEFFAGIVEHLRTDSKDLSLEQVFPYYALYTTSSLENLRIAGHQLLIKMVKQANSNKNQNKINLIEKACKYIDENYIDGISLEQAASHLFISPVYLSKLFKEIRGINFKEYIIEKRLGYACKLLSGNENYKVYEICQIVGYKDVKYFYQLFQKKIGYTPIEYKERNLTPHSEELKNE